MGLLLFDCVLYTVGGIFALFRNLLSAVQFMSYGCGPSFIHHKRHFPFVHHFKVQQCKAFQHFHTSAGATSNSPVGKTSSLKGLTTSFRDLAWIITEIRTSRLPLTAYLPAISDIISDNSIAYFASDACITRSTGTRQVYKTDRLTRSRSGDNSRALRSPQGNENRQG